MFASLCTYCFVYTVNYNCHNLLTQLSSLLSKTEVFLHVQFILTAFLSHIGDIMPCETQLNFTHKHCLLPHTVCVIVSLWCHCLHCVDQHIIDNAGRPLWTQTVVILMTISVGLHML